MTSRSPTSTGSRHAEAAAALADHADDGGVDVAGQLFDLVDGLADRVGTFGNARLGDVILEVEQLLRRQPLAPHRRDQAPAGEGDEDEAGDRHRGPDRGEVEHAERIAGGLVAEGRDDDVGRRADHGDQAAENGAERQRHEHHGRRLLGLGGGLYRHRHQQGERADVVHDRRQARAQARQPADVERQALRRQPHVARDQVDGAGVRQRPRHDEHQGHRHGGRVSEAAKRAGKRHHAGDDRGEQREKGDDVVAPAPPGEEDEDGD